MVVFPSVGAVLFGLSVACCRGRALYLPCHGISKLCEILSPLQKKRGQVGLVLVAERV